LIRAPSEHRTRIIVNDPVSFYQDMRFVPAPGRKIMTGLIKSILKMPAPWLVWIMLLLAVNMIVPMIYIQTLEAQLTLVAMMSGVVAQSIIHARLGFVKLLGLGHVLWIPLVIWLGLQISDAGLGHGFGIWLASLVLLNTISLIIDFVGVVQFILGNRTPAYAG